MTKKQIQQILVHEQRKNKRMLINDQETISANHAQQKLFLTRRPLRQASAKNCFSRAALCVTGLLVHFQYRPLCVKQSQKNCISRSLGSDGDGDGDGELSGTTS